MRSRFEIVGEDRIEVRLEDFRDLVEYAARGLGRGIPSRETRAMVDEAEEVLREVYGE
jgi:hypothetical protein